jgi:AraC family transcriptional regulator of adaptative response/methylated-DNA-[protein]-cysteine methyltransferase
MSRPHELDMLNGVESRIGTAMNSSTGLAQAAATMSDPRWKAVVDRDHHADGAFWYSVKTTGVYCRPSCGARIARPENIQFHQTIEAAQKAGFRACKRCRPDGLARSEESAAIVAKLCRLIERSEKCPSLGKLAELAGMSVSHLHRTFKSATGLTPNEYAAAYRSRRVRKILAQTKSVTDAIYEAGFSSNSRFYEQTDGALGMTPTNFRNGGTNTSILFLWPGANAVFVQC